MTTSLGVESVPSNMLHVFSPHVVGMSRNTSKFMSAEEAARRMIVSVLNGDRELIMTRLARLGQVLRVFVPYWFYDALAARTSAAAFSGTAAEKKKA